MRTASRSPHPALAIPQRSPTIATAVLLLLTACGGAPDPRGDDARPPAPPPATAIDTPSAAEPRTAPHADAARALVRARPAAWRAGAATLLGLGPAASPALVAALRAERGSPGEQPAVAVLGELGGPAARSYLLELLDDGDDRATAEAALALGRLGDPDTAAPLIELAADPSRDPLPRAGALAALLDLRAETEVLPLLRTFLLAGSPQGHLAGREAGLPDRARWALELEILMDALARRLDGHRYGLDPDQAWADRAASVERALAALADAAPESDR